MLFYMNSRQFLQVSGLIIVVLGILGFFILGPSPGDSIFGTNWWFDGVESWVFLVLGLIGIISAYTLIESYQVYLACILGIIFVLMGLYSLTGNQLLGANLEVPGDTLFNLAIGILGLWVSLKKFIISEKKVV